MEGKVAGSNERSLLSLIELFLIGHDHKRARKIMLPGFGGPESRSFLPVFIGAAGKVRIQQLGH